MKEMRYCIPMLFSTGAMAAGLLSIIQAAAGHYLQSAQLIMLSMILDGFDGNLARKLNATSQFGAEFDTFVDIMSFGIAPALLAYWSSLQHMGFWGTVFACTIVLSGMTRLARFRVVDPARGAGGYLGLPITVNAGWIAICVYLASVEGHWSSLLAGNGPLIHGALAAFCWGVSILMVILQVSHVRYQKPTKHWGFMIPAAIATFALFEEGMGFRVAVIIALYGLYYTFLAPVIEHFQAVPAVAEGVDDPGSEG